MQKGDTVAQPGVCSARHIGGRTALPSVAPRFGGSVPMAWAIWPQLFLEVQGPPVAVAEANN